MRCRAASELKERLYEFLELGGDYWLGEKQPDIALTRLRKKQDTCVTIILLECQLLAEKGQPRKLKAWHKNTEDSREILTTALISEEPRTEQPEPERIDLATAAITHIVTRLYEAC